MGGEKIEFDKKQQLDDVVSQIVVALQGIRFGSVEIIIQKSQVVQIVRRERLRFDV
jgi:hypothetical protein